MWDKIWFYIQDFGWPFIIDLGSMLLKLILIITIMLVVLEILKAIGVLNFLNKILFFVTKPLGISESASMPLLIGLLAGITYGAGAILASFASNEMNKKDVVLVSVFLCICHGIIEDTLLFAAIGSIGWVIFIIRLVLAIIITIILNIIFKIKENKEKKEANFMK